MMSLNSLNHISNIASQLSKLGQNFLANVETHDEMDQNSDIKAVAKVKEVTRITKVVRNVVTVELIIHLIGVQHMEKTVFSAKRKDISVHTVDLARTANSMVIHPQEDLDINMKWNKMTMVMIEHSP